MRVRSSCLIAASLAALLAACAGSTPYSPLGFSAQSSQGVNWTPPRKAKARTSHVGRAVIYVTNEVANNVTAYDKNGNEVTLPGSWAGLNLPGGITYDRANGLLYVTNNGSNTITAYDRNGNPQTLSGSWTGVSEPWGITYCSKNGLLYVVNQGDLPGTVTAYDQSGNQQTLPGTWAGDLVQPTDIAYDENNGYLYVVNSKNNAVETYDRNGNQVILSGGWYPLRGPTGIAYDKNSRLFYVTSYAYGENAIEAFDQNGNLKGYWSAYPAYEPSSVAYDPGNGLLYVTNFYPPSGVFVFDQSGNPQTLPGSFPGTWWPSGIAFVPAQ